MLPVEMWDNIARFCTPLTVIRMSQCDKLQNSRLKYREKYFESFLTQIHLDNQEKLSPVKIYRGKLEHMRYIRQKYKHKVAKTIFTIANVVISFALAIFFQLKMGNFIPMDFPVVSWKFSLLTLLSTPLLRHFNTDLYAKFHNCGIVLMLFFAKASNRGFMDYTILCLTCAWPIFMKYLSKEKAKNLWMYLDSWKKYKRILKEQE
nr:hypothetical protein K-LCC10_0357 [Kaumoebavirus]